MRAPTVTTVATAVLLCSLATAASAQELVANGGFETGTFSSWTPVGNTLFQGPASGGGHTGSFGAAFGAVGTPGGISQTLTTVAGATYTFSFWLQLDLGAPFSGEADWNGAAVFSMASATPSNALYNYAQQSFTTTATGTSTVIQFLFRDDPGSWLLDDVSVVGTSVSVTPEPATMGMLASGLLGLVAIGRRRKPTE